jgi:hypothetical protein
MYLLFLEQLVTEHTLIEFIPDFAEKIKSHKQKQDEENQKLQDVLQNIKVAVKQEEDALDPKIVATLNLRLLTTFQ